MAKPDHSKMSKAEIKAQKEAEEAARRAAIEQQAVDAAGNQLYVQNMENTKNKVKQAKANSSEYISLITLNDSLGVAESSKGKSEKYKNASDYLSNSRLKYAKDGTDVAYVNAEGENVYDESNDYSRPKNYVTRRDHPSKSIGSDHKFKTKDFATNHEGRDNWKGLFKEVHSSILFDDPITYTRDHGLYMLEKNYNRFKIPDLNLSLIKGFPHIFFTRPDCNILDSNGNLTDILKEAEMDRQHH